MDYRFREYEVSGKTRIHRCKTFDIAVSERGKSPHSCGKIERLAKGTGKLNDWVPAESDLGFEPYQALYFVRYLPTGNRVKTRANGKEIEWRSWYLLEADALINRSERPEDYAVEAEPV